MADPSLQTAQSGSSAHQSLDSHLARGVAWTAVSRWSAQAVSWASMLVLARLLSPADYGLIGMANVYLGLVAMISELGLGSAVLTLHELSAIEIRQLHTCSVLLGILAFAVSGLLAIPISWFYHSQQLPLLLLLMSVSLIPSGFRTVPMALLQRDMKFRPLSVAEGVQAVVQAVGAVVLAWLGLGYWALAWSGLVGALTLTAIILVLRREGMSRPHFASLRPALTFGWHTLVTRVAWYGYSNADFLVAGRMLGATALGAYTLAWNLASLPVEKITTVVTRVTPSIFAAARHDNSELRRHLGRITEVLAFVTLPAAFGLGTVAPDLVVVLLGPKWNDAILPLRLLAFYIAIRSLAPLLPQVLTAKGDTRYGMHSSLFALLVMPAAFVAGARWGLGGIAWAWVIAYPVVLAPFVVRASRLIGMKAGAYLHAIFPPLVASVFMVAAVLLLQAALSAFPVGVLKLAAELLAGIAAYCAAFLVFYRERLRRYRQIAVGLR